MKSILKVSHMLLVITLTLIFVAVTVGSAGAEVFKIKPKGDKKIKIGVIDPNAAIEAAAFYNKAHKAAAKARGWEMEYFDLKDNFPESAHFMENMISAGYDAIILHWLPLKMCEAQIKRAFEKGIPVITIAAQGARFPGVVQEFGPFSGIEGAMSGEYLATKIKAGDKVLMYYVPPIEMHQVRAAGAKAIFAAYNIKIAQEIYYPGTGDPMQHSYDSTKNALLGDPQKEIKGLWASWEGFGISAARAANDMGRKDFIVTTIDDYPNTYTQFRNIPTVHAIVGSIGFVEGGTNRDIFDLLDRIFKGEQVQAQQIKGYVPYLVTRENLPPKGYFFNYCGYKGRRPDFEVK